MTILTKVLWWGR